MKRYTLSVYDNTVKEPVMTVQVDEFSCTHGEDGASVRAGKPFPFTKQVFNIEQKFAAGFDPGRVFTAINEDAAKLARSRLGVAANVNKRYPPEILALRDLLLHHGWVKTDVLTNPGEEVWKHPKATDRIRVMDPAWFDSINLPPFLSGCVQLLASISPQGAAKPLDDPNYNTTELRKVADYILTTPESCTSARERYLARAILARLKD